MGSVSDPPRWSGDTHPNGRCLLRVAVQMRQQDPDGSASQRSSHDVARKVHAGTDPLIADERRGAPAGEGLTFPHD
jgi:hypothetical protein